MLNLAPLHEIANAILPLLDQQEELKPYAAWLRARLDFLAVADEFQWEPAELAPEFIPANPSADAERQAWRMHLKKQEPAFGERSVGARRYSERLKRIFQQEGIPPSWSGLLKWSQDSTQRRGARLVPSVCFN